MAEKKITKAAATKAANKAQKEVVAAPKAKLREAPELQNQDKKGVKKACAKKPCATKAAKPAKNAVINVSSENVGFKAGDVFQALAAKNVAMTPAEIAKAAKIAVEEAYLGMGWLFKEGKIKADADNKIVLA